MGTRAWIMTPEMAEAFFEQCLYREAVTEKERIAVLEEMAAAQKIKVFESDATKQQIVDALAKHYRTWMVSKKREHAH